VEHGYILDDECIELFLKHDTWYVPTLAISHLTPEQANNDWEQRWVRQRNMAHALCCRADAAADVHRDGFAKALKAGVKMALGSDIRPLKDAALLELGCGSRWRDTVAGASRSDPRRRGDLRRGTRARHDRGRQAGRSDRGRRQSAGGHPERAQLKLVLKEGVVVSDKRE
jgi:hypothetical protein